MLDFAPVPEPGTTLAVFLAGTAGYGYLRRRRARSAPAVAG
jgi:hypothetical protein